MVLKQFDETPFCVAIHPSGSYLVVGFADALRLFTGACETSFSSVHKIYAELNCEVFTHIFHFFFYCYL